jgi:hypothetical protein
MVFPGIDAEPLASQKAVQLGPLPYAVPIEGAIPADTHGTGEELCSGGRLWRLRLSMPGATDLNFGFTR